MYIFYIKLKMFIDICTVVSHQMQGLHHKNLVTNLRMAKTKLCVELEVRFSDFKDKPNIQIVLFWLVTPHSLISRISFGGTVLFA
jgi:hypothetical protein